jgi:hypothetical protein
MRRIFDPIQVNTQKGWPHVLHWGANTLTVKRPIDFWIRQGHWWAEEQRRVYFRLITSAGVVEIYEAGGNWVLAKVSD